MAHDEKKHCREHHDSRHKYQTQPRVDGKAHDHAAYQHKRCPHSNTQNHLIRILDIGDIRSHPGNKTGSTVFINVGKRKGLYVFIHSIPQVAGKAGRSPGGKYPCQHTRSEGRRCQNQHQNAVTVYIFHISCFYSFIYYLCRNKRNEHLHQYFQRRKKRSEQ